MYRTSVMPKYVYTHDAFTCAFDSFEYECGTKISEYEILTNNLSYAVNGDILPKITLKGRFLSDDYLELEDYISENTGNIIQTISINGKEYYKMVLLKATAFLPAAGNIGEMTFILQKVVL